MYLKLGLTPNVFTHGKRVPYTARWASDKSTAPEQSLAKCARRHVGPLPSRASAARPRACAHPCACAHGRGSGLADPLWGLLGDLGDAGLVVMPTRQVALGTSMTTPDALCRIRDTARRRRRRRSSSRRRRRRVDEVRD